MTADDVRARLEAWMTWQGASIQRDGPYYTSAYTNGAWAGYRAAHADLAGEVRELVEAATEIADNTENWNRAVIKIIGRQPNTGIGTERLRAALAKLTHQEKP